MVTYQQLLTAAEEIQPELETLLGTSLTELLRKAEQGEDVELDLLDLLSGHEETRQRLGHILNVKEVFRNEKGFSSPPGQHTPPDAIHYVCTVGCTGEKFYPRVQVPPPLCVCGEPMKLKD